MSRNNLSVGKTRGLSSTSTRDGVFTILALDHRQSFFKMINPQQAESVSYQAVVEIKSQVVRTLSSYSSAVLLDPIYGAAQAVANGACPGSLGLIVAVEETGYSGSDIARRSRLLPDWNVAKSRRMGADAVKAALHLGIREGRDGLFAVVHVVLKPFTFHRFLHANPGGKFRGRHWPFP